MSILYSPTFGNFSAQTSGFEDLVNGGIDNSGYFQPASPEMEAVFSRFLGSDGSIASDPQKELRNESVKQVERPELKRELPYIPVHDDRCSTVNTESNLFGAVAFHNPDRAMGTGNVSNLIRQHSSPAGFLSSITVENGFAAANGESSRSRGLNGQINFNPDNSWREVSFNNLKRMREDDMTLFSGLSSMDSQTENKRDRSGGLIHHLSLPKTFHEMAAVEKILHFQDAAVPCKIRAKRGFATHPRSIAERNRRGRISERMRKLQDLFPDMDKANTADMLDLALGHIKNLQEQVKTLSERRVKCTCPCTREKH